MPEIVRAFYENNKLESVYLMSNGQIQHRIIPDVVRILDECPNLNVAVALGIDGLKDQHEKIRRKPGSWDKADRHSAPTASYQARTAATGHPNLHLFYALESKTRSSSGTTSKYDLKPDKVNFNYIRPPSADPVELDIDHARYGKLAHMIDEDSRHAAIKNNYAGDAGFFKAAIDIYMHGLISKTQEEQKAQMTCYAGTAGGVIYDEGTVSSCENLEPVGNFARLRLELPEAVVFARDAGAPRRKAADGCFCTHGSNGYYPSLPFNPRHLVKIKSLEREMKKARREHERLDAEATGVAADIRS
ncbi:MAG: hypothetical protein WKF84_12900 [Pyrinomonadaceae bacterium]